ncbi:hypothetical protein K3495_g6435 [Podosphaera aphanis]|nr:hypothetical protein K3495_g6435 [Podosphaera aphanis]
MSINCKEFVALWRGTIHAPTDKQHTHLWAAFNTKYITEKTGSCALYLENYGLKEGQRERLLQAYTDYYFHYGARTSSRAEGAHAFIKRYLGGKKSRGSLLTSWLNIERPVLNQLTAVAVRTNASRDYKPLGLDRRLFQGCCGVWKHGKDGYTQLTKARHHQEFLARANEILHPKSEIARVDSAESHSVETATTQLEEPSGMDKRSHNVPIVFLAPMSSRDLIQYNILGLGKR